MGCRPAAALMGMLLLSHSNALAQASAAEAHYNRGVQLVRSGNLEEALQELEKAATLAPENPKVHNMLGVALTQMGRLEEADRAYDRALALAPDFLAARKNRAVNSFSRKDYDLASREFRVLREKDPSDFVPPLFLGLLALQDSQLEKALGHLLEAQRLAPGNPRVLTPLGRVSFLLGRYQEAEKMFGELWEKGSPSYEVGFNLALVRYRQGRGSAALAVLEQLLAQGQKTGEALNLCARIYTRLGRLDLARESLQAAIGQEPDNPDHYLDLSTLLINHGDRDSALKVIRTLSDRTGENERLQVQMGLVEQVAVRFTEAEKWYRKACYGNSTYGPAYLALANLLLQTGRVQEAGDFLDSAVQRLPRFAPVRYLYASLLLESQGSGQSKDLDKAGSLLKEAVELEPFYGDAHYLLGKYFLRKSDFPSARASLEKACALNPTDARAHHELSRLLLQKGETEKALEHSRIAQQLYREGHQREQRNFNALVEESLRQSP